MADPNDGLPATAIGGSRQTLKQLRNRWGVDLAPRADGTIHVHSMQHEVWRPLSVTGGEDALYQLEHRRPA